MDKQITGFCKKYDTTRPLNYSGGGWFSKEQDMVSLHMQEHYTRIMSDWQKRGTQPLIIGEFWVGGRADQRLQNSAEIKTAHLRSLEEAKSYEEKILEMRYFGLAGMMPFRTSLLAFTMAPVYKGYSFSADGKLKVEAQPGDVIQTLKHALQPVTVFFWPRQTYADIKKNLQKELVLCNDGETANDFEVSWGWSNKNKTTPIIKLKPGDQYRFAIVEPVTLNGSRLVASVKVHNKMITADTMQIAPFKIPALQLTKVVQIYKDEKLAKAFGKLGIKATSNEKVPSANEHVIWVIPEHANNRELNSIKSKILAYLQDGGTILCLKQDGAPTWFPIKFNFSSANQSTVDNYGMMGWEGLNKDLFFTTNAQIYAIDHPVFKNLNNNVLHGWDPFDGRVADDVFARPSATNRYGQGNWRPLAGGTRREQVSLAEIFDGRGTLLSCQLNVIENANNSQAKALLVNMLNYLSAAKLDFSSKKVTVRGNISADNLSVMTGSPEKNFEDAAINYGDVMMAFPGATVAEIKSWAGAGGKAIIFSGSLSQDVSGVNYVSETGKHYTATKQQSHPLFYGVSSANFINGDTLINGYFKNIPPGAKVLLQGFSGDNNFWKVEDAGPVMISIPFGKGEIILSSIEFKKNAGPAARELLGLLLTNSGVQIPFISSTIEKIKIKKTVPLSIDGKLNEWLEDMEDRLVTPYVHAQPIYLTSENTVKGPQAYDLNLSSINYFLWNEKALHIAGVVFMEKKFFGAEAYPGDKVYTQEIIYNSDTIVIDVKNKNATVTINGKSENAVVVASGQINAKNMTDATQLQFNYIHASGKLSTFENPDGETFEIMIP